MNDSEIKRNLKAIANDLKHITTGNLSHKLPSIIHDVNYLAEQIDNKIDLTDHQKRETRCQQ